MTVLAIDHDQDRPLYLQIADAVRRGLVEATLGPGDRLPSGRDLAEALGVNTETVQRAYRLLASQGIVVSRVGRGTKVAADITPTDVVLTTMIDSLVDEASRLGVGRLALLERIGLAYPE